jgi:NitT/TauT family transport system substrate-binding protein
MVKKRSMMAIAVILMLVIGGIVAWYITPLRRKAVEIVGSLTLGFVDGEAASAIYIADKLDFFAANGVKVTLRPFGMGLDSYKAMLKGEIDVSGPTEYPIVVGAFRGEKIQIVSSIVKADLISIIGRKDQGIEKVSDLARKRIGLPRNTISEFFLGRFPDLHGLRIDEVILVDMNFSQGLGSIQKGAVDAVVTLPPFYDSIKGSLGASAVEWSAQSGQLLYGVLTCRNDWIARNPLALVGLLRTIEQANLYIAQHPKEAKAIVRKRLNLDAGYVDRIWQRNLFSLSLEQSLVTAMEDEARWMIHNNLTAGNKTIPNFLDFIHTKSLKEVNPNSVNIIR